MFTNEEKKGIIDSMNGVLDIIKTKLESDAVLEDIQEHQRLQAKKEWVESEINKWGHFFYS